MGREIRRRAAIGATTVLSMRATRGYVPTMFYQGQGYSYQNNVISASETNGYFSQFNVFTFKVGYVCNRAILLAVSFGMV